MASGSERIAVVGLGYVGLPLAVALARHFPTIGLDVDSDRIAELKSGHDRTGEISSEDLSGNGLVLTDTPADCAARDIYIVTVPTPVDSSSRPDLAPLASATNTVADANEIRSLYGRNPVALVDGGYDLVIGAVRHSDYEKLSPSDIDGMLAHDGIVADIKAMWRARRHEFQRNYWSL